MLIITVVISAIIGLTLAAYLSMVQSQHLSVMRSQSWNAAIPACEAGIEEALAHLNSIGNGDRATNGWTLSDGVYVKSGSLQHAEYDVSISPADSPVVISYGYVPAPLGKGEVVRAVRVVTSRQSTGMKGLVAKGAIVLGPGSIVDSYDSRVTLVYNPSTAKSNAFVGAVNGSISGGQMIKGDVATGPGYTITSPHTGDASSDLSMSFPPVTAPFSGGFSPPASVTVTVTNFSVNNTTVTTNLFPSPLPASGVITNVVVKTNTSAPATGSYSAMTVSVTETVWPGSSVGTVVTNTTSISSAKYAPPDGTYIPPYVYGGSPKRYSYLRIDSYTYSTSRYVYAVTNFIYSTSSTNAVTTTTEQYAYVLDSDNYKTTLISLSGTQPRTAEMLVRGDAVLWVTEGLVMTGNARITILPGASLKIYVGDGEGSSAEIKIAGNGVLNMPGDTEKMSIFGMSDNTVVKIAGNGTYVGTVYAPSAELQGKGSGSDVDDFQGAAIVANVSYNGHFNFHYDEKLGDNGGMMQWKINSWTEF
ncbi:MAG TPA: hypothetical protein VGH19_15770 [Verrucomicrobiae bacterium]